MATSYTLSLLLSAIDKASGPIKEVANALTGLGQAAQQTADASKKVGADGTASMQSFRTAIVEAQGAMESLAAAASAVASQALVIAAAGAAMSAAFLFPVKQAADFEHAMTQVMAITHATQEEFKALSDKAIELGLVTKFTGTQIAEGMNFLARSGLTATQMIAALPAVVNLATAAEVSMADASGIVVSGLKAMGMGISDLTHFTDVLAKTSTSSNTTLNQLGDALKFAAPAAKATSTDIDALAAVLGVLAQAGLKGHMAGTELRQMMVELSNPTAAAKAALHEMQVEVGDSTGKMRPLIDILGDLAKKNMDLDQAAQIFNARTATGVLALTSNIDKVRELDAVNKQLIGTTQEMADIMVKNVIGAWVNFKATIEGFSTAVAGPLLVSVKAVIDGVNIMLQGFTKLVEATNPVSSIFLGLVGVMATFLIAGGGVGLAIAGIIKFIGMLGGGLGLLFGGFGTAAAGSVTFANGLLALRVAGIAAVGSLQVLYTFLLTNPWGWAILAITAVVGGIYSYVTATDAAIKSTSELAQKSAQARTDFDETVNSLKRATEGSQEHHQILAQLVEKYPELASQLNLTNQSLDQQQEILAKFRLGLVATELGNLSQAAAAAGEKMDSLREKAGDPSFWQKIGAAFSALSGAAFTWTLTDLWNGLINAPSQYFAKVFVLQQKNQQDFAQATDANLNKFKKMFEIMGVDAATWGSMTKDQMQQFWDSQDAQTKTMVENWKAVGGTFDTFVAQMQGAQKRLSELTTTTTPGETLTPDQSAARFTASSAVSKLATALKGASEDGKASIKNLASFMEESLSHAPAGVRAAWLAEIDKIIKGFELMGDKGSASVERFRQQVLALNNLQMSGQLPGIGGVTQLPPGMEGFQAKPGATVPMENIQGLLSGKSPQIQAMMVQAVNDSAAATGIDPAWIWAIMKRESGGTPAVNSKGYMGLGQVGLPEAKAALKQMGFGDLMDEAVKQYAMSYDYGAKMIAYVLKSKIDTSGGDFKKAIGGYIGAGAAGDPAAYLEKEYAKLSTAAAQYQTKGSGALVTEKDLEITKNNLQLQLTAIETSQKEHLIGEVAAAEQIEAKKLQIMQVGANITATKLAEARRVNDTGTIPQLEAQLKMENAAIASAAQISAITVTGIKQKQRKEDADANVKAAESQQKDEQSQIKVRESAMNAERAQLAGAYANKAIDATNYYTSLAMLDEEAYKLQKVSLEKGVQDVRDSFNKKRQTMLADNKGLDTGQQQTALTKLQTEEANALRAPLQALAEIDNKRLQTMADQDAKLKEQKESALEMKVLEIERAAAIGPVSQENVKIIQLQEQQKVQAKAISEEIAKRVALYVESKGLYGISPEEGAAWQKRLEMAQKVQMQVQIYGEEAKRWGQSIADGISGMVDALMQGGQDMKAAANTFFQKMLKDSLAPGFKALQEFLTQGFQKMFSGLGDLIGSSAMGQILGNAIMGLVAVVGMMLTSKSKSSFTASGVQSDITTHEAVRGVIAGETSIPIAQVATSLSDAVAPHLSVLQQIEANTRSGLNAQSGSSGPLTSAQLQVVVTGISGSVTQAIEEYFKQYLITGAKA